MDNGQGLGVRNAGHIGASAGSVKIDSQGRIVNSGTISATHQADLNAEKVIENKGKIETKQGNAVLRSTNSSRDNMVQLFLVKAACYYKLKIR